MSNKGKKRVNCPHCKKDFDADFWTVVRGDLDFELKEMIINGEFDLLLCPECGKIFSYEDTFVYMDPACEIMAFVLPSDTENSNELIEKMKADYELIKNSAQKESSLSFKPYYFFGAQDLASLLLNDRDIEEETEVMEFLARESGFKVVCIKRSAAREKDFLFSIPYSGEFSADNALSACEKIFSLNDRLKRLGKIIDFLRISKSEEIDNILKK
ncbi:MAG: hypothetical protein GX447_06360 [Elusimicrobia bacterium]|nr:hypothetical protein [Elusimicrobiota bacterium]